MTEWMIVAVFFLNGESVRADAIILDSAKVTTEAECRAVIPQVQESIRQRFGLETVAECRRVPPPPEKSKTTPQDKKSEVTS